MNTGRVGSAEVMNQALPALRCIKQLTDTVSLLVFSLIYPSCLAVRAFKDGRVTE